MNFGNNLYQWFLSNAQSLVPVSYTHLNSVLVEGKLYKKNEVVKTIRTDIEGVASASADLLPYGKMCIRDR